MFQDTLPLGHCPTSELYGSWVSRSQDALQFQQKHNANSGDRENTTFVNLVNFGNPQGKKVARLYT